MAIAAQSLVRRATDLLQDQTSIRWTVGELVRYLNDGQREVVLYRPDAMVTTANMTCVAGTRQTLPVSGNGGAKLIDVIRNNPAGAGGKAVRQTNREILDAQIPGWHTLAGVAEILHYTYDIREPKVFYVYPPATVSAKLDIIYSAYPTDITEPASGDYTAVTGNISVPDIYGNTLLDYILYRAYSKDSEYAGNAARAQAYYQSFANALGIEVKATAMVAPAPVGNPNAVKQVV